MYSRDCREIVEMGEAKVVLADFSEGTKIEKEK